VAVRTSKLPDVPESTGAEPGFDVIADELYGLPPDEFVPARDDRVAAAKESGDRELARALARLRRPTKAAWLANLLARHRTEQLDGLVSLARSLTQAQQELDGDALRALSGQRHRAVGAMARDAGRLAARRGEAVNDALVREVAGILDAALADPAVAEEVRAGRLTKTVRYSGFGPAGGDTDGSGAGDDMAAWAASAPQRHARPSGEEQPEEQPDESDTPATDDADSRRAAGERAERERAERERREQLAAERAARERELAEAEAEEEEARARQESDEADRDRADERHASARDRVTELAEALDTARDEEQATLEALRAAATAARDSARGAAAAAVRTARARSRLEQLSDET
jgi:hypothetical protein